MEKKSSIAERYFEKPKRLKTFSGIPVREVYTPEDVRGVDYTGEFASGSWEERGECLSFNPGSRQGLCHFRGDNGNNKASLWL